MLQEGGGDLLSRGGAVQPAAAKQRMSNMHSDPNEQEQKERRKQEYAQDLQQQMKNRPHAQNLRPQPNQQPHQAAPGGGVNALRPPPQMDNNHHNNQNQQKGFGAEAASLHSNHQYQNSGNGRNQQQNGYEGSNAGVGVFGGGAAPMHGQKQNVSNMYGGESAQEAEARGKQKSEYAEYLKQQMSGKQARDRDANVEKNDFRPMGGNDRGVVGAFAGGDREGGGGGGGKGAAAVVRGGANRNDYGDDLKRQMEMKEEKKVCVCVCVRVRVLIHCEMAWKS